MSKRKGKLFTFYMDDLDYDFLEKVAADTNESKSVHVRTAINEYLIKYFNFDEVVNNAGKHPGYYRM